VHDGDHRARGGEVSARDRIRRRVMPRAIVALSTVRMPGRVAAGARRALGGSAAVRLYVAFDDPYSAVAVLGLDERVAGRRARLLVEPVVERGIPGDPAVERKREYAVLDSRRLARRAARELSRSEPVPAESTAFLADWAAAIPQGPRRTAFCVAAMRLLWFESDGPVATTRFESLWHEHTDGEPPAAPGGTRRGEREMRRRRLYDTPVAVVHGQWFFAHERLSQIEHRLDELGWAAA
jgi:2-hydroxychromene-2-carboxylate isomerase